jgi:tRNA(Ile)-lysidine synthase
VTTPRDLRRAVVEASRAWADERVLLAVSGGADSVALAWLFHDLAGRRRADVAGLVHVHHGLRGADADEDEAFVVALGARLGWPVAVERVQLGAGGERGSVESRARAARYAAFDRAADRLGAARVATAHTLDDQAETVLLRLLRGAGTRGLSGIRPARGRFVRPLLACRRQALRDWLIARTEPWREDASNADVAIARNRIRHTLVPVVDAVAPGGVRAIARVADLLRLDEAVLSELSAAALARAGRAGRAAAGVELDVTALSPLPPALAARAARQVLEAAAPGRFFTLRHVQAVARLWSADKSQGHLDLPGVVVSRRGARLVVEPAGPARQPERRPFRHVLEVPGSVDVPEAGVSIHARLAPRAGEASGLTGRAVAEIGRGGLALPLVVRSRLPGDRVRPIGAPGRRKLQDVLVDRRVPRDRRDAVPIVADAAGRIVWVAEVVVAEDARVQGPLEGVVILELRTRIE